MDKVLSNINYFINKRTLDLSLILCGFVASSILSKGFDQFFFSNMIFYFLINAIVFTYYKYDKIWSDTSFNDFISLAKYITIAHSIIIIGCVSGELSLKMLIMSYLISMNLLVGLRVINRYQSQIKEPLDSKNPSEEASKVNKKSKKAS
jgi:FlaA1/EpsC-like NDP-sugar epimerase